MKEEAEENKKKGKEKYGMRKGERQTGHMGRRDGGESVRAEAEKQ